MQFLWQAHDTLLKVGAQERSITDNHQGAQTDGVDASRDGPACVRIFALHHIHTTIAPLPLTAPLSQLLRKYKQHDTLQMRPKSMQNSMDALAKPDKGISLSPKEVANRCSFFAAATESSKKLRLPSARNWLSCNLTHTAIFDTRYTVSGQLF